jgi:hypothetical protein
MPCLNVSTNVNLEGVDTTVILAEASKSVANIIGKPEAVSLSPLPFSLPPSSFFASRFVACVGSCRGEISRFGSQAFQNLVGWRLCFHFVIGSCNLLGF